MIKIKPLVFILIVISLFISMSPWANILHILPEVHAEETPMVPWNAIVNGNFENVSNVTHAPEGWFVHNGSSGGYIISVDSLVPFNGTWCVGGFGPNSNDYSYIQQNLPSIFTYDVTNFTFYQKEYHIVYGAILIEIMYGDGVYTRNGSFCFSDLTWTFVNFTSYLLPLKTLAYVRFYFCGWGAGFDGYDYLDEVELLTDCQVGLMPPTDPEDVLQNMEGCGPWVFAEEKMYFFNISVFYASGVVINGITIQLVLPTTNGTVTCSIIYDNNMTWTLQFSPDINDFSQYPIKTEAGEVTSDTSNPLMTIQYNVFHIWFTNNVLDVYEPTKMITIYGRVTSTSGADTGIVIYYSNLFYIYSKGGFSLTYNTFGSAYRVGGGDVFDFYAGNGSWVESDLIFHNLQHVKLLPEFTWALANPFSSFTYILRIDYCTAGTDMGVWQHGWEVRVSPCYVAWGNPGSLRYVNWTVAFYNNDSLISGGNIISTYHDGTWENLTTHSRLWFDLWINRVNASTTVGLRVNAYEYAMSDSVNPWLKWLAGGTWGPIDQFPKDIMFFDRLLGNSSITPGLNIIQASEAKLFRIYCKLVTDSSPDFYQGAIVRNYEVFDLTIGKTPLEGIQTPVFDTTKVPSVKDTGFLGTLFSALNWLGGYLLAGLTIVWGWMQQLFIWLAPYVLAVWDAFYAWAAGLPYVGPVFSWFVNGVLWVALVGYQLMLLLLGAFSGLIMWITAIINGFVQMLSVLTVILSYSAFLPLVIFMIMVETVREGVEEGNWTPLLDMIGMTFGIIMFFINWGMRLLEFVMDRILGGLPV